MKIFKKIFIFALILVGLIINFDSLNVNAAEAPLKVTLKSKSSMYYFSGNTDYINGYNFYRKELKDGTFAYCISNVSEDVPAGMTLTSDGPITDKGLEYIIKNGYPNKSMTGNKYKDYYITQSAIWRYFDETRGSSNWKDSTFTNSSTGMKAEVYKLVQAAKIANTSNDSSKPSISANVNSNEMTLSSDSKYFVSGTVKVSLKNTKDTYEVKLVNAPSGSFVKSSTGETKTSFNKNESFIVYVPVSSLTSLKGNVTVTITTDGITYRIYSYTSNKKGYQNVAPVTEYEEITKDVNTKITFNYEKDPNKVKISKQDITSKEELAGATLVIKDKNGKVIDEWVSTTSPHYIEDLKAGEYTLTEKIAPNGYVLSTETITFTVKDDGSVQTVVMYNTKEATKIKISKQDITSKEELAGATLVVKDKDGNVIDEWVSTTTPHYIEGLEPGRYTLTETIAPDGYVLSTETITFTIEDSDEITSVVMYNVPYTDVPITDLNINSTMIIVASTLMLLGTGLVVYYAKYSK